MRRSALLAIAVLALAGCSAGAVSSPPPSASTASKPAASAPVATAKPAAKVDPVAQAITDRYGDCLVKLKFVKPFTMDIYPDTAVVSGTPGVVTFHVAKSNTGSLLIAPVDSDNSARALASVGCT